MVRHRQRSRGRGVVWTGWLQLPCRATELGEDARESPGQEIWGCAHGPFLKYFGTDWLSGRSDYIHWTDINHIFFMYP